MVNSNKENKEALRESSAKVTSLNCINLSSPDIQNSVSLLKQACLDCGFFYVINHGISQEFMDEVFAQSKRFFDLPVEEKMKVLRNEKHRGYTPVLDEYLDPVNQINGDYKEGYYIGIEVPEDDPEAHKPFYGPNLWPAPDILSGWRETMEKYHHEALETAKAIARILALALDLESDFFERQENLGRPIAILRLLHYEGQVSEPNKGIYGAGAHTDFGLITLLATDDVLGLQICKDKDAKPQVWEYVTPLKGAFIVNLGDMLEHWSNCRFRSTLHRVLGNGQERYSFVLVGIFIDSKQDTRIGPDLTSKYRTSKYSLRGVKKHLTNNIAFFVEPSHHCNVECLPTCQSQDNPPKFPPIKCETYLLQRYKETHADINSYKK